MSSAGTSPRRRSRSFARMAAASASVNRSVLLRTTIERFPWRTRAASGSYSVRIRSWSSTKTSRSARAARSRASRSRSEPASPDLRQAGRVGQEDGPFDPFQRIGVVLGPLGRAHGRLGLAGFSPEQCVDQRRLAGRAGAEDDDVKLPAVLPGSDLAQFPVQPGPGRLVCQLAGSPLRPAPPGRPRPGSCRRVPEPARPPVALGLPEQPARPERADRQQDDQDDQKGETQARRMSGKPVVELGHRAEQPGAQPQRQEQCRQPVEIDGREGRGRMRARSAAESRRGAYAGYRPSTAINSVRSSRSDY